MAAPDGNAAERKVWAEKRGSFEDFFREVYPRLAHAGFLLTRNAADAEDLAQEALARAYERWERVNAMTSPEGYVYRIALNLNRKRLRAARRALFRTDGPSSHENMVQSAETREDILAAVSSLTRSQREAVILVDWLGTSVSEAAEILGLHAASFRTRLHRGRAALRDRLGGTYG